LSRLPIESNEIHDDFDETLFILNNCEIKSMKEEQQQDNDLLNLFSRFNAFPVNHRIHETYSIVDGVVYKKDENKLLVVIPQHLKCKLLQYYHESKFASHPGRLLQ
jgi:hypothetical protein